MLAWYHCFLASVIVLWATSTPKDRPALRVVLLATVGSFLLTEGVTRHIMGAWKLVIPGMVETLTILRLLRFADNRTGYMQAGCLVVAWFAHAMCYSDLMLGTDWVYSRYEDVLMWVGAGQLAVCYDTLGHNLVCAGRFLGSLRPRRAVPVCAPSVCAPLLHNPRLPGV